MVNLLGSLFYGTILGIFVVAFFIKWIKASAVFWSAIIAELCVLAIHFGRQMDLPFFRIFDVEYLWYNVIGCVLVVVLAVLFQAFRISRDPGQP